MTIDSDTSAKTQATGKSQNVKSRPAWLTGHAQSSSSNDLDSLLRFWVGIILALTLVLIVSVVLYSLVFVTQPIDQQAPNDREFFKLITPLATFIAGALGGVMAGGRKGCKND